MTPRAIPANCVAGAARAKAKRATILRLVLASGTAGLTMPELRTATGMPISTIGTALRESRDDGKVEATHPRGGPTNRWGAPGVRAAYAEANSQKLALAAARIERRRLSAERKQSDADASDQFARPSLRRIVPAHLAAPLRPAGPCWVFAMGLAA